MGTRSGKAFGRPKGGVTSICRLGKGVVTPAKTGSAASGSRVALPAFANDDLPGRTITLFGRCRDLYAAERRHYLLREPVQLFQRLDERGAERHDPERMFDPRPNPPQVIQSADCLVDAQGVMYLTDNNAGLCILQFEGA